MLAVLLWALAALAVLVLAVLALPVRLRFRAESEPVRRARVELGLLGGLVPWIGVADSARPRTAKHKPERPKTHKKRRTKARASPRTLRRMLRAGPDLLIGMLRQIRVERFLVECRFGLADPADTGQLFGMLAPVAYGGPWIVGRPAEVTLTPVFDRACLDGRAEIALSVVPLRLLPPALRFGWAAFGPAR